MASSPNYYHPQEDPPSPRAPPSVAMVTQLRATYVTAGSHGNGGTTPSPAACQVLVSRQNIENEGLSVENSPLLLAAQKSPSWVLGAPLGRWQGS